MNAIDAPIFIDTNILVYAYDQVAGDKYMRAESLLHELWFSGRGRVSIQVLQEFYVTATHKAKLSLPSAEAVGIIADISQWGVHVPAPADILSAITLQQDFQISFWDAMILWSAAQMGCDTLHSEDFNHDQLYGSVKVINPFL